MVVHVQQPPKDTLRKVATWSEKRQEFVVVGEDVDWNIEHEHPAEEESRGLWARPVVEVDGEKDITAPLRVSDFIH